MFGTENFKEFGFFIFFALFTTIKFTNGTLYVCIPKNTTQLQADIKDVPSLIAQIKTEVENVIGEIQNSAPIDTFPFDFSHPAITLKGSLNNFTMDIGEYELKYLNIQLPATLELFNLTIKSVNLQGTDYNFDGHVGKDDGLFKLYGSDGSFWMNPQNISVAVRIGLEAMNSSGLCVSVNLAILMEKLEVNFNHIMGGDVFLEPLFNKLIGQIGQEATGIIWNEWASALEGPMQKFINKLLNWDQDNGNTLTNLISWAIQNQNDILSGRIKL